MVASRLALPTNESGALLDLLVVFQFDLEQPDHLYRDAGRTGDSDDRELVGRIDLLDVTLRDDVAHGGSPIAGHHDATRKVAATIVVPCGTRSPAPAEAFRWLGSTLGATRAAKSVNDEVSACRKSVVRPTEDERSLTGRLLDEGADELLRVHLQHVVDLIQQGVDL